MTDHLLPRYEEPKQQLSWPRIAGTSFAIALHVVVFMTLMAPVSSGQKVAEDEDVTLVSFIEPPPPPPPPPEEPPIVYQDNSPVAVQAPPPAPPAPAAAPADFEAEVDPTGRSMNPPQYPREEQRRGITGTVILALTYDVTGAVLDVNVAKSSGNKNLDRAAIAAARRWKINPAVRGGQKIAGVVNVPVEFKF